MTSRVLFVLLVLAASPAAADVCPVGTRVQVGENVSLGTIAEIGTKTPHVGWYRVTFGWSPGGEWYDPSLMPVVAGGRRCAKPGATTPQPRTQSPGGSPFGGGPAATVVASAECPFVEPPGRVTREARASAELFKRVIYERAAAKVNPDSISAPKRIGLTFLEFEMGEPFVNRVYVDPGRGARRLHDGAPPDAMVYPVRTKELQCDLHGDAVRRSVTENQLHCFVSRSGTWTCPGRTRKSLESRLIPR